MLRAAWARQQELEKQHTALAGGLHTVQQLLARRVQGATTGSRESCGGPRCSSPCKAGPRAGDKAAMAALSTLLHSLNQQWEGLSRSQASVLSPISEPSAAGPSLGTVALQAEGQASGAQKPQEPLDISSLLPLTESEEDASGLGQHWPAISASLARTDAAASVAGGLSLDRQLSPHSAQHRQQTKTHSGCFAAMAVCHSQPHIPDPLVRTTYSRGGSTKQPSTPAKRSHTRSINQRNIGQPCHPKGSRILRLALPCGRCGPGATRSSSGEPGRRSISGPSWK
jgi:hypothetical protein